MFLISRSSNCQFFLLWIVLLVSSLRTLFTPDPEDFLLCVLFPLCFRVLHFTFSPWSILNYAFVYIWDLGWGFFFLFLFFFFSQWKSKCSSTICWKSVKYCVTLGKSTYLPCPVSSVWKMRGLHWGTRWVLFRLHSGRPGVPGASITAGMWRRWGYHAPPRLCPGQGRFFRFYIFVGPSDNLVWYRTPLLKTSLEKS